MNIFAEYGPKYAAAGLHVFPVSRGKTPLTQNGWKDASTDLSQIELWSQQFPDANIAIACGPSGLVVLDLDAYVEGSVEAFKALCKEEPAIYAATHATRAVKTGGGGYQYYFKAREGIQIGGVSASKLGPGLDTRAHGGYVVAPPSIHASGKAYEWLRAVKPIEIPMELVAKLKVEKWTVSEKLSSDPVGEGGRNDYLMRAGCSMRAKGFEHDEILAALTAMNHGRCNPPLDEAEVEQLTASVCRYERGEQLDTALAQMRYVAKKEKSAVTKGRRKLEIRSYNDIKEERIDWLWFGRIAYGKLTILAGLPGKTKSYLTHAIAAMVSKGEPLPGDYINLYPTPGDVLLVTYEDGEGDTVKPRLRKLGADMSRIHSVDMDKAEFSVEDVPQLEALLDARPEIRLIVIDPMQNMMIGVNSYRDEDVRQALQPLIRMAMRKKVAILGIKHFNKNENLSIDSRLAGAGYQGVARSIIVAGYDNEKEFGPNGEVYAGAVVYKGNIAGLTHGVAYEVNDRGLFFLGEDPTLNRETVDRLLPRKPGSKKEKES